MILVSITAPADNRAGAAGRAAYPARLEPAPPATRGAAGLRAQRGAGETGSRAVLAPPYLGGDGGSHGDPAADTSCPR